MHSKSLLIRVCGFIASLILTLFAFMIVVRPAWFPFKSQIAISVILTLAVMQFIVQSLCFLNLQSEKGPRWNLLVFGSTLSIILIIIAGSIWIMTHLNYNMIMN